MREPSVREHYALCNYEMHPSIYPEFVIKYFSVTNWYHVSFGMKDNIDDSELKLLSDAICIREIDFGWSPLSDEGMTHLARNKMLRVLNLSGTKVTDKGIASLTHLDQLVGLSLSYMDITDASLAHLAQLKSLKHIDLYETPVSDEGVCSLQRALPGCEIRR